MRRLTALVVAAGLALGAGCGRQEGAATGGAAAAGAPGGGKVVGVSLLTQNNDFFKDLEEGLRTGAAKHGWRVVVQSAETNATAQSRQLEDFVTQKVDAIVVCPVDSDTVAASLRAARDAKVPVFTADIAAKGADVVSHVASDNYLGGKLAGQAMGKLLGGKGKVIVIDHPSVSSVQDRTRGFEDAVKAFPGISIAGKPSAEGQRAKAQAVMEDALQTHPDLAGVFAINDVSALGALRAVEASGRKGVAIVGYDAIPEAQDAIRRGSALKASVVQYPRKIGEQTIDAIARHFGGGKVEKLTPVEVGIVDAESLSKSR